MCEELNKRFAELSAIDKKYIEKINILNNFINNGFEIKKLTLTSSSGIRSQHDFNYTDEELGIIHREKSFAYTTTRYGDAFKFVIWVVYRKLNIKDLNGLEIFESPSGIKYIIESTPGCPEAFGSLIFKRPKV